MHDHHCEEKEHGHDTCCCGHDHEHEHEECCCEHDHEHEHGHEECCCGHEHEHEHEHEKCCCGHDHHHHHEDECGCGHDHEHGAEETGWKEILPICIGAVLFIVSFFLNGVPKYIALGAAYLLIGLPVLIHAVTGLLHGKPFDEEVLMTVATVGAFCIGEYAEGVAVMLFYRIGEWVQDLAVARSRNRISDAVALHPDKVRLLQDGREVSADPDDVPVGSRIIVGVGERIGLDGIVEQGESRLDCSSLTGESATVAVRKGSEVKAGTVNTVAVLEIVTTATSENSATGRLLHSIEDASEHKPKLQRFITRFSRIYTPCVVGAAVLLAAIPILLGKEPSVWIHRALMFLVISCPCALVLSIPLTFFAGLGLTSRHNVLFKGADGLEALAKVTACVLDKTGTLTDGVFAVQNVTAEGMGKEELLSYAASVEQNSPHPAAHAILQAASSHRNASDIREHAGKGVSGTVDGKQVLVGNAKLLDEFSVPVKAFPGILVAVDGVCAGGIEVGDKVRDSAQRMISELNRSAGYTALLTGDGKEAAQKVASELGITEVHAQLLPEEKLETMRKIRMEHGSTMFLGDGINDAPVLAGADIGVAMAEHGTDMAAEAADALLLTDDLSELSFAHRASAYTNKIAKENIGIALGIKAAAMILSATGVITGMWIAVFADVGAALICILNALRVFRFKKE